MKRLRPTLIALAILALSATAVFAAGPARPAFAPGSHQPEASESAEATETAEATQASEASEAPEASHPVNHGCVVSLAAHTATPSGFKNHGAWVSSIAKNNHGHNKDGVTETCTLPTPPSSGSPAASANP
jgi:hypothetical protein